LRPRWPDSWDAGTHAMEANASLDQASSGAGSKLVEAKLEPRAEDAVQQVSVTRTSQASVSAALAAANDAARAAMASPARLPEWDRRHSFGELAQRDLDAALQLLADRAQYITGARGAAIALRRSGKSDMLCRASSGSSAPELGTLLSTEFGLSGESVRTRRPLRCDNAERDARVNREACHEMGIASVVVMPVVQDDEVLGVFELFSDKVNAFGGRDVAALERLGEMVETAVRLARAAEGIPQGLQTAQAAVESADVLEVPELVPQPGSEIESEDVLELPEVVAAPSVALPASAAPLSQASPSPLPTPQAQAETPAHAEPLALTPPPPVEPAAQVPPPPNPSALAPPTPKRVLFWSAALNMSNDAQEPAQADQSGVPPVLRNLRKCEVCGFPVSAGRVLCVECEEKRWQGRLRVPQTSAKQGSGQVPVSGPTARAAAAMAQSAAAGASVTAPLRGSAVAVAHEVAKTAFTTVQVDDSKKVAAPPPALPPEEVLNPAVSEAPSNKVEATSQPAPPEVVFSAGLEPSQSWLARNRYIFGAFLLVAAIVAAVVLLR